MLVLPFDICCSVLRSTGKWRGQAISCPFRRTVVGAAAMEFSHAIAACTHIREMDPGEYFLEMHLPTSHFNKRIYQNYICYNYAPFRRDDEGFSISYMYLLGNHMVLIPEIDPKVQEDLYNVKALEYWY